MAITAAQRLARKNFNKQFSVTAFDNKDRDNLYAVIDSITALQTSVAATQTSITNLNAWATALATKLNADAGVTDTNYDTNPQA